MAQPQFRRGTAPTSGGALHRRGVCRRAALCLVAPWSLALRPCWSLGSALAFLTFGAIRWRDAWSNPALPAQHPALPRYVMTSRDVPVSQQRLFIGRAFVGIRHAPTRADLPAEFRRYVEPTAFYRGRAHRGTAGFAPFPVSKLAKALAWDSPLNPAARCRHGGLPRLHGIEPRVDVSLPLGERVGPLAGLGTTRGARPAWPSCSSPRTSGARWAASTRW